MTESEKLSYIFKKGQDNQKLFVLNNIFLYKGNKESVETIVNELEENLETYNQDFGETMIQSLISLFKNDEDSCESDFESNNYISKSKSKNNELSQIFKASKKTSYSA